MKTSTPLYRFAAILSCFLGLTLGANADVSDWQTAPHIKVRLVSEPAENTDFFVGLELVPDEHWHVYWRNPGDSGMPVSIAWSLPSHIQAQNLIWPNPTKIPFGHLTNYGYEGRVILPTPMHFTSDKNANALIKADASWLVCKETCIPGAATLQIGIDHDQLVSTPKSAPLIAPFAKQQASKMALLSGQIEDKGDTIAIELFAKQAVFKNTETIEFFPINEAVFEASAKTTFHWKNNYLLLSQKKSESYSELPEITEGLLVLDGKNAVEFSFSSTP